MRFKRDCDLASWVAKALECWVGTSGWEHRVGLVVWGVGVGFEQGVGSRAMGVSTVNSDLPQARGQQQRGCGIQGCVAGKQLGSLSIQHLCGQLSVRGSSHASPRPSPPRCHHLTGAAYVPLPPLPLLPLRPPPSPSLPSPLLPSPPPPPPPPPPLLRLHYRLPLPLYLPPPHRPPPHRPSM